jgi:hypothetical protein
MKNTHTTETSEREYLQRKFPEFTAQDFNDLYGIYPFKEYFVLNRIKTLVYWKEVLTNK